MSRENNNKPINPNPAATGNASNPSPRSEEPHKQQIIDEKGEKYLRESGNIEDLPDQEAENMEGEK